MPDVDQLLRTYIERYESGGDLDPADLLDAAGDDRAQLQTLIEGYLEHAAPAAAWDPVRYRGSVAERAVESLADRWEAEAQPLPELLRGARRERQLKRASLVDQLAQTLGVAALRDRVALHYHRLEQGLLDPAGVQERVWDALASILDTSAETLRRAGSAASGPADQASGELYARTAIPDAAYDADDTTAGPPRPSPGRSADAGGDAERYAEVDDLFLGGD